jgi:hypothetical protein
MPKVPPLWEKEYRQLLPAGNTATRSTGSETFVPKSDSASARVNSSQGFGGESAAESTAAARITTNRRKYRGSFFMVWLPVVGFTEKMSITDDR